jgi:hypothetical protein
VRERLFSINGRAHGQAKVHCSIYGINPTVSIHWQDSAAAAHEPFEIVVITDDLQMQLLSSPANTPGTTDFALAKHTSISISSRHAVGGSSKLAQVHVDGKKGYQHWLVPDVGTNLSGVADDDATIVCPSGCVSIGIEVVRIVRVLVAWRRASCIDDFTVPNGPHRLDLTIGPDRGLQVQAAMPT